MGGYIDGGDYQAGRDEHPTYVFDLHTGMLRHKHDPGHCLYGQ